MNEPTSASRWGRRRRSAPQASALPEAPAGEPLTAAAVQVLAHTLIADLFGAGLRVQNIASRAPEELEQDLSDVADQIDKVIGELRNFAFTHR